MTTKEVAQICGVTDECVRQNAKKVGIVLENGKAHDYTEDELKRIQIQLMKNAQNNNVNASDVVKEASKAVLEVGLVAKACLESPEAWEQFKKLGDNLVEQKRQAKELEAQNQLLLEQKEKAEAETERIYQVNKNFHTNLYTATDLARILGTTANKIGRIANEHGLKQDPIYGKLGKDSTEQWTLVRHFLLQR